MGLEEQLTHENTLGEDSNGFEETGRMASSLRIQHA